MDLQRVGAANKVAKAWEVNYGKQLDQNVKNLLEERRQVRRVGKKAIGASRDTLEKETSENMGSKSASMATLKEESKSASMATLKSERASIATLEQETRRMRNIGEKVNNDLNEQMRNMLNEKHGGK